MAIAATLIIGEIFSAGFFLIWFGIGAAVAGILTILGLSAVWQWGSFIVISGVLFVATRQFADHFTKEQPPGIGADRLIAKEGIVLEKIDNINNTGRIQIGKKEWKADSETEEVIPEGKRVNVTGVDGTHVVVRPIKDED